MCPTNLRWPKPQPRKRPLKHQAQPFPFFHSRCLPGCPTSTSPTHSSFSALLMPSPLFAGVPHSYGAGLDSCPMGSVGTGVLSSEKRWQSILLWLRHMRLGTVFAFQKQLFSDFFVGMETSVASNRRWHHLHSPSTGAGSTCNWGPPCPSPPRSSPPQHLLWHGHTQAVGCWGEAPRAGWCCGAAQLN